VTFLLCLLKLVVSDLKIAEEDSSFRAESMDNLFEICGVFFVEAAIEQLLFLHKY